jgi:O-antigen/teichoic acid export membrane protein
MPPGSPAPTSVLRNTLILVGAQLIGTPLTILINAFMGRYLGADDLGYAYLAGTLTGFGFLFVEWGQGGVIPAAVAQDRSRASVLMGSALAWKAAAALVVSLLLLGACWILHYSVTFQSILLIVAVQCTIVALSSVCQDVVRGFERTDVAAFGKLAGLLLSVALVIPTLVMGGGLKAVLVAQMVAQLLVFGVVWRLTRRVVPSVSASRLELRGLVTHGTSFLAFGLALTLQGNVDAVFLSKLTSAEVVGWHAAAQKLQGALVIPASALISALYPTLARLYVEDMNAFRTTASRSLKGTAILAVPLALCCAIYRDVGISLYSERAFAPAGQNLLILSGVLFLVYFSMPLGTALVAAGGQRKWAVVQASCVLVSFGLDPVLIPWFQKRYGNGGLGICVGGVVSEVFMVGTAMVLSPKGIVDRSLATTMVKAGLAGVMMVGVAYLLRGWNPLLAAPPALAAYAGGLWLLRGIEPEQIDAVRGLLQRKLNRP